MTAQTHCLSCQVPLVPGTGFCGTCGTPVGQAGAAAQVPPSLPLPPGFAGGHGATAAIGVPPMQAAASVAEALRASGATVDGVGPGEVMFSVTRASLRSFFLKRRYHGHVGIEPAAGGALARVRVKLEPASTVLPILLIVGVVLALSLVGNDGHLVKPTAGIDPAYERGQSFGAIVFFGGIGLFLYWLMARAGKKIADGIAEGLRAALVHRGPPPHPLATPTPGEPPITEQLRALGLMHQMGSLTDEELAQSRAALLARL